MQEISEREKTDFEKIIQMMVSNEVWLAALVICKQLYEHEEYLISDQIFISYYRLTKSKILDAI